MKQRVLIKLEHHSSAPKGTAKAIHKETFKIRVVQSLCKYSWVSSCLSSGFSPVQHTFGNYGTFKMEK